MNTFFVYITLYLNYYINQGKIICNAEFHVYGHQVSKRPLFKRQ